MGIVLKEIDDIDYDLIIAYYRVFEGYNMSPIPENLYDYQEYIHGKRYTIEEITVWCIKQGIINEQGDVI